MRSIQLALLALTLSSHSLAQADPPALAARERWQTHQHGILAEYREFLSLPNSGRHPDQTRANADWIVAALEAHGIETMAELLVMR